MADKTQQLTVRFNLADPHQAEAVEILKNAERPYNQVITEALTGGVGKDVRTLLEEVDQIRETDLEILRMLGVFEDIFRS